MNENNTSTETKLVGSFSKLITSKEPPKPQPMSSKEPPKPSSSKEPPKPSSSKEPPNPSSSKEPPKLNEKEEDKKEEDKKEEVIEEDKQVKRDVIEEVIEVKNDDVDSVDFINRMNNTQRNLGHNKLHIKIKELEEIIEKYKVVEQEADMKIHLFKKTITTLQGQLQEKSANISRLETAHIDPQYEKQILDLNQIINDKKYEIDNLNDVLNNNKVEIDYLKKCVVEITSEKDMYINQLQDVKQSYASLENSHQKQAVQLQINIETILKLQKKIEFEETLKNSFEIEMKDMKSELTKYRTDIKNMTIEKDAEIENLKKQLETYQPQKQENNDVKIRGGPIRKTTVNPRRLPVVTKRK